MRAVHRGAVVDPAVIADDRLVGHLGGRRADQGGSPALDADAEDATGVISRVLWTIELVTIAMGVVTSRLVRGERRRSAARLAALAAELKRQSSDDPPLPTPTTQPSELPADPALSRPPE